MFLRAHKAVTQKPSRLLGTLVVFSFNLCVGALFNGQSRIGFEIRRVGELIFQYIFFFFKFDQY